MSSNIRNVVPYKQAANLYCHSCFIFRITSSQRCITLLGGGIDITLHIVMAIVELNNCLLCVVEAPVPLLDSVLPSGDVFSSPRVWTIAFDKPVS